ncbi:MAG: amidohydrolase [Acidimicrobiales bacterium]|nr:amidohydrolase [Acidimicrobiales bacterium]
MADEPTDDLPWIISVDDHVVEPPGVWQDRLSQADRAVGPRVVKDTCETRYDPATRAVHYLKGGDGPVVDWWLYEDVAKPIPKVVACAGYPFEEHTIDAIAYEDMRPGCYDPVARLDDMDINRTERSLCFPYITRFAGQLFLEAKDKDLALRCVQAYNDWMVDEWCAGSGGRLLPLGIVPLWDAELAAAEVRRNAERGMRAITFTEMPHFLGLPSIHDPDRPWDPLFQACDDTGTVVCMHIGSGSKMADTSPFAPRAANTALTFSMAQASLVDWLTSGNLVRFPGLKIAYSESQTGWMPFILDRLDKVWEHREYAGMDPIITEPPSSYMAGRVWGSFFDDEVGIESRHRVGVSQIVIEVDYPHQDTTWPDSPKIVENLAAQVTPEELVMITRTNALDMLGLTDDGSR